MSQQTKTQEGASGSPPHSHLEAEAVARMAEYIERNATILHRTLCKWITTTGLATGPLAVQEANELFGRLALEAMKTANRYDPARPPQAWIFKIASHMVLRWQEETIKNRRRQSLSCELSHESPTADEELSDAEIFDLVCAADGKYRAAPEKSLLADAWIEAQMSRLSAREQEIVRMSKLEEMNMETVARKLGIPASSARVYLHRALVKLRKPEHHDKKTVGE